MQHQNQQSGINTTYLLQAMEMALPNNDMLFVDVKVLHVSFLIPADVNHQ
jgi:hypothetical protein